MDAQYHERLRGNNLKVTPKRRAVIGIFLRTRKCFGPRQIWQSLKPDFPRLGLPSIYRILEELRGCGILDRMERRDRRLCYALCTVHDAGHHHHFVCRKCERVEEVDFCNFRELAGLIEKQLGGKVESHDLRVEGLCKHCR